MTVIPYGPFAPDQPRLGNTCVTATNVLPGINGYRPFPGPTVVTDALVASCVGVISFKQVDGTIDTFAGTTTKLFRLNGTSWDDVSRTVGGAYATGTFWQFAVYGKRLIATNGIDEPQAFDLGVDTDFADLPNAPIAAFFIVIRDVLVALAVNDGSIFQIKFSAVNDSEKWTADCGGGAQQVPDGGPVIGGTGGEFGVVLQESGLTRMEFVGGDLRFTFDKIEGAVGCISSESIVEYKGRTFYLSEEGFQLFDGAESKNISDELISDFFFDDVADATAVRGALWLDKSVVVWVHSSGTKAIIYNYRTQRWASTTLAAADCVHAFVATRVNLGAFDGDDKLVTFTSTTLLAAIISTGDLELSPGSNSFVKSVTGLIDSNFEIRIGSKRKLKDTEVIKTKKSYDGKADIRVDARYHRIELRPIGTWTEVTSVDVEAVRSGKRG